MIPVSPIKCVYTFTFMLIRSYYGKHNLNFAFGWLVISVRSTEHADSIGNVVFDRTETEWGRAELI